MITMPGTQHLATVAGVCLLVELDFTTGIQRLSTAPINIPIGGNVYTGLGTLAGVSGLQQGIDSANQQVTLSLSIVSTAMLAAAMGDPSTYRGKGVRIYLQLLNDKFAPVDTPVLAWQGVMNKAGVTRKSPAQGGNAQGSIDMQCSASGMARARHVSGLRTTLAQQQQRYPSDTGLRYVRGLIDKPSVWLTKAFQQK